MLTTQLFFWLRQEAKRIVGASSDDALPIETQRECPSFEEAIGAIPSRSSSKVRMRTFTRRMIFLSLFCYFVVYCCSRGFIMARCLKWDGTLCSVVFIFCKAHF